MSWNLERLRTIAGISESLIYESWDDDEDPDVARAEKELKKNKVDMSATDKAAKNVDPEKDLHNLSTSRKSKDNENSEEKDNKASGSSTKEPVKDNKASGSSTKEPVKDKAGSQKINKTGALRDWMAKNPGKSRKEAWAFAQTVEFTPSGFSTIYQTLKGKKTATECYVLTHPHFASQLLGEDELNKKNYRWFANDDVTGTPLVFESMSDASVMVEKLDNFTNYHVVIKKVTF